MERIIEQTDEEDNQEIPMGLYMMRGGNVVCIGEVDEDVEFDWTKVKGDELKGTKNPL